MPLFEEVDAADISLQGPFLQLPSTAASGIDADDSLCLPKGCPLTDFPGNGIVNPVEMELRTDDRKRKLANFVHDLLVSLPVLFLHRVVHPHQPPLQGGLIGGLDSPLRIGDKPESFFTPRDAVDGRALGVCIEAN